MVFLYYLIQELFFTFPIFQLLSSADIKKEVKPFAYPLF